MERVRASNEALPAGVWSMSALFMVAGALAVLASIFPITPSEEVEFDLWVGILVSAAGAGLWVFGARASAWVLHAYALVGLACISILVAISTTALATSVSVMPYIWLCVFVGQYFDRPVARAYALMICAGFAVALQFNDSSASFGLWLVFSGTVVVTVEVLARIAGRLKAQARYDSLTGLVNRNGLEEAVTHLIALSHRAGNPMSIVLIDLDGFKQVNDRDGHLAGDRVLASIAREWDSLKRSGDVLARFGGDEFVLVMPGAGERDTDEVLDRFREASPLDFSHGRARLAPGDDLQACLTRADAALYKAKSSRAAGLPE